MRGHRKFAGPSAQGVSHLLYRRFVLSIHRFLLIIGRPQGAPSLQIPTPQAGRSEKSAPERSKERVGIGGGGYPPKKKSIKIPLVFPLFLGLGGGWIPPTRHLERSWDRLLRFLCVSEACRFLMRFSIDKKSAQNRKNRPTDAYTH